MNEIDINRHNELIDPHLEIWGWEIAVYLYLGGMAAGIMVFAVLAARRWNLDELSRWVRWLPFAAPALVSLGMFLLFLDLEAKQHVYRFYLALRPTAPMSWGSWILIVMYPSTLLLGLAHLNDDEVGWLSKFKPLRSLRLGGLIRWVRGWALERLEVIRWTNVIIGVILGLYTGLLLGTLEARPLWNSTLLAPLFLVSGLSTGAAFMMLFPLSRSEHHLLRRWDLMAIGAEVTVLVLFLIDRATSGARGNEAAARFFGGDLTAPFWTLVVVGGLAVPVMLELIESRRGLRPTLAAPVLILIGGLALRWIMVFGGQNAPLI